jgi:hypothetical protein
MTGAIERLIWEMERNLKEADSLTRNLSDTAFNWRPHPAKWSIAQCIQHLVLFNEPDFPHLDRAIAEANSRGWRHPGPYDYGFLLPIFISTIEPPPHSRFPAPGGFVPPAADLPLEPTLAQYHAVTKGLIQRLRDADGLDLGKAQTALPVLPLLKLPLGGRLALLAAHDRRHLWQAKQVRNQPGFPGV